MHKIRPWPGILLLALAAFSHAADEFEGSVPADLVRVLAGGGEIFRLALPPDFPDFTLPEGIRLMGSHAGARTQRILMRTTLSGAEAQTALAEALMAGGWRELAPPGRQVGFVVPVSGETPVTLCHDDFGNLEIRGEDGVENRVYVERDSIPAEGGPGFDCEEQNRRRRVGQGIPPPRPAIHQYASVLLEATRALQSQMPVMLPLRSGARYGQDELETETYLGDIGQPIAEVNRQYVERLQEMGWELDARWAGELSAGSLWSRETEEGLNLTLILRMLQVEPGDLSVTASLSGITPEEADTE